jgi:hypothetical protein
VKSPGRAGSDRRRAAWLVGLLSTSFVATTATFMISTVLTEWRARGTDSAKRSISTNAVPAIDPPRQCAHRRTPDGGICVSQRAALWDTISADMREMNISVDEFVRHAGLCPACWGRLAFRAPPRDTVVHVHCPEGHSLRIADQTSDGSSAHPE